MSDIIKREGKIQVRGFDPKHSGLAIVWIPLNKAPDADWINCFEHPRTFATHIHPPKVQGPFIVWRADKDKADKDIEWIFKYIEQANTCYQEVLKEREERKARMQEQEKLEEKELEKIKKKFENL